MKTDSLEKKTTTRRKRTKVLETEQIYSVEIVRIALYDIGRSIDLKKAASLLPGTPGMRIVRRRDTPESLTIPTPLCVDLRSGTTSYNEEIIEGFSAVARLYDEGVMAIIVRLCVSSSLKELHGIENRSISTSIHDIDTYIDTRYRAVLDQVKPAIHHQKDAPDSESYLAYCFADVGEKPEQFLEKNRKSITTLLLGEAWDYPVHESQIKSALNHPFMYAEDDLAIFDIDRCILIDVKRDYEDILLICELANYQYLELRTLDKLLDKWLDEAEDDVSTLPQTRAKKKINTKSLKKKLENIQKLRMDALFILENLENSAKIIGDYYLGQVYEYVCGIFNTTGWTRSVERRIDVLQNIYDIVKDDRSEHTKLALDVLFIVVCVILPLIQILQVMVE